MFGERYKEYSKAPSSIFEHKNNTQHLWKLQDHRQGWTQYGQSHQRCHKHKRKQPYSK